MLHRVDTGRKLDIIQAWADETRRQIAAPAFQRDPAFIARLLPYMELYARYFAAKVRDLARIPEGPVLLVGNHSGGAITPDTSAVMAAWYRQRGLDAPLHTLAFDAAFGVPGARDLFRKLGLVPANRANAAAALARDAAVLVYPGGVHEVFRPWRDRNRIDFNGRTGFVQLALRTGVPVVPVVGHGGHETTVVLSRGDRFASWFGYDRLRLKEFPILLQVPWGVSTPAFPGLPLPAKITVQIGEPIRWADQYGPDAADDPAIVRRCYDAITDSMQSTLTTLAQQNPRPLASRLRELLPRSIRRRST